MNKNQFISRLIFYSSITLGFLLLILLANNSPENFAPEKIDKFMVLINIVLLGILAVYTHETQLIRQGAENREMYELRGYFGLDQMPSLERGNTDSLIYDDKKVVLNFKNFGKTPLLNFTSKAEVVYPSGVNVFSTTHTGSRLIVPSEIFPVTIGLRENTIPVPLIECRFFYLAEYQTYSGKKYYYKLELLFKGPTRLHLDNDDVQISIYETSEKLVS